MNFIKKFNSFIFGYAKFKSKIKSQLKKITFDFDLLFKQIKSRKKLDIVI